MLDDELFERLKTIFRRFVLDQASDKPFHKPKNIPDEIHGELADLLFQDKVKNQLLVYLLIGLFVGRRDRTDAEILQLLKDVDNALSSLIF